MMKWMGCVWGFLIPTFSMAATLPDDAAVIRQRLVADYLQNIPTAQAQHWLDTLEADGSWADIPYDDQARGFWKPQDHVKRIKEMATAWHSGGKTSAAMLAGIERALRYWNTRHPICPNWWFNHIGIPQEMMRALIMLEGALPEEVFRASLNKITDPSQAPASVRTGQNLVWQASQQLVRGVLSGSAEDIAQACADIQSEIRVSEGEGIQPDFSFHQHGPQIYNGGYGKGFSEYGVYYAALLAGTRWGFSQPTLNVLADYLLEGQRYMVRHRWFDYSARGREPARRDSHDSATSLIKAARQLATIVPERAVALEELAKHIEGTGTPASFIGNRHFWRSDFMTHQRAGWYASVRMLSARTAGAEVVNAENKLGYWSAFGMNYLVRDAEEYRDIWPVWDWFHLPGTTAPAALGIPGRDPRCGGVDVVVASPSFVGGVSDGHLGASAMVLDQLDTQARKAWFFFDEGMVALGAGIRSTRPESVATTLNQALLRGEVWVDGQRAEAAAEQVLARPRWVLHDGFAYVPLQATSLTLRQQVREGSWSNVSGQYQPNMFSKPVFGLSIEHGIAPQQASYAYAVLGDTDAVRVEAFATQTPWHVLSNTEQVQAVSDAKAGITQVVFYAAGTLELGAEQRLSVDAPCILLLKAQAKGWTISAANPLAQEQVLNVRLEGSHPAALRFALPGGAAAGSSVTQQVE